MNIPAVAEEVDLAISHHQIQVRSRDFREELCQWGEANIEQGAVIQPGYITFDPIAEDAFRALVKLSLSGQFQADPLALRRMVVPFQVLEPDKLELLSVPMHTAIGLPLAEGEYALYFEICGQQEIYYRMTFVPAEGEVQARFLLDDEWGGAADQPLLEGYR